MYRNSINIPSTEAEYLTTLRAHCPFVQPAQEQELLLFSKYTVKVSPALAEEAVFYRCVVHTETMRQARFRIKSGKHILCENVVFDFCGESSAAAKDVFSWPHWCLKVLYTSVGVMFGKFWVGERTLARNGQKIPEPAMNFISVRSAIKIKDERFFQKSPHLIPEFFDAADKGDNILIKASIIAPEESDELLSYFKQALLSRSGSDLAAAWLADKNVYQKVKKYAQIVLERNSI